MNVSRPIAVLAEIIVGALVGALIGVPLTFLLTAVVPSSGGGFQDVVAGLAGLYFGYIAGAALGVTLMGRFMKQGGAWWAALGGAILGAVLVMVAAAVGLANFPAAVQIAYFALTAILSAAAYTWTASR